MNERIKELESQCWEARQYGPPWFDYKKFAELIVRECIAQCEQVATAADAKSKSKFVTDDGRMLHEGMWGGAKNCSGQIKQHFGVAE
jgi:hypothetical protein